MTTDVGPTVSGKVVFHPRYANVDFGDVGPDRVKLFVYVDDTLAMTLTVKGALALVVPLDARAHHKIVTGTARQDVATAVWASCSGSDT